jgi:hypothetical protein
MPPETNIPMDRLEFHRHGLSLVPKSGDKRGGIAILISGKDRPDGDRFCSCPGARGKTCPHLLEISRIAKALSGKTDRPRLDDQFRGGHWFALGAILADGDKETPNSIRMQKREGAHGENIRIVSSQGREMVVLHPRKQNIRRLLERCGNRPADPANPGNDRREHRGVILKRLARLTISENERIMSMRGFRSRMQGLEESFWYFLGYHHFMEYGDSVRFRAEMVVSAGDLILTGEVEDGPLFRMRVRRQG